MPWHPVGVPCPPGVTCAVPSCPHSWVLCEHGDFRGRQWLLDCTEITNWLTYSGLQHVGSLYPIRQVSVTFGRGQGTATRRGEPKTPRGAQRQSCQPARGGLGELQSSSLTALAQGTCHQLGPAAPDSCPPPWEWLPLW